MDKKKTPRAGTERMVEGERLKAALAHMQAALEEVDRAGPLHNPEFAGAVYERIAKLAAGNQTAPATR